MSNLYRGQVSTDGLFGEGSFIAYQWDDLASIEEFFKDSDWWQAAMESINQLSPKTLVFMVKAGLRNSAGAKIEPIFKPGLSLEEVAQVVADALCYSTHGISVKDLEKRVQEREIETVRKAAENLGSPPGEALTASSDVLDALPSGPDSSQANSGD